ncbi:MAG: DNA-processing protein DprA [Candidatus Omnitrophica bacterium]|jgi:DNA processing protein|nr:DNA-processing protein DprA [Candidatus Omnitrophota bacterium]
MAKKSTIFLNLLKSLNPKKIESIISFLSDTEDIFNLSQSAISEIPLLEKKDIDAIINERRSRALDDELERIGKERINVVDVFDEDYPKLLKEIAHPPLVLYVKGNVKILNEYIFAIVGSRIPTVYGLLSAKEFAAKLASLGITIISGLARGIDTAAHKGALERGKTIAVLGSGLMNIYPKENTALAETIIKNGALVSEFPLDESPYKENFPRRNRIVSGLSHGVLVVEAAEKSGALITAHCALEQNREVFALPGKIDSPVSRGAHVLIKEGAKLVDSISDILEELNIKVENTETRENTIKLKSDETIVFDIIGSDGAHLEEIILKSKMAQSSINRIILDLQLNGVISEIKPSYFARTKL